MVRVYGSRISYYTGKLEAYLRLRGIDYELLPTIGNERKIIAGAGAVQNPVAELEDGRWLSDTTPILAWMDGESDGPSIYPRDPALRFAALLLEDYADEWLWRPAMHYRWSFVESQQYASGVLADELLAQRWWPRFVKRFVISRRQFGGFVQGDGVSPATRAHVESTAWAACDLLEVILAERNFILGDAPTIADFGFVGPMFRHLGQDPTPAELMRKRTPRVYSWVARMWEAAPRAGAQTLVASLDAPLAALLREACETHLVQLRENAAAYAAGRTRFEQRIQGCHYRDLPVSRYRVWCLEELRRHWRALEEAERAMLRPYLPEPPASVLWDFEAVAKGSGYDPERRAPFNRAINVFGRGVPPRN